jgi:curved DNA-binding protein CbpA
MTDIQESYQILELQPGASYKEVKAAYRRLVRLWHPDLHGHNKKMQDHAQEQIKDINRAYEILVKHLEAENESHKQKAAEAEHRRKEEEKKRQDKARQAHEKKSQEQVRNAQGRERWGQFRNAQERIRQKQETAAHKKHEEEARQQEPANISIRKRKIRIIIAAISCVVFSVIVTVICLTALGNSWNYDLSKETSTKDMMPSDLKKDITVDLIGGVKIDLVLIQPGTFMMGANPAHKVTLTKPFYMGKYEVTQEQWRAVVGDSPSYFKDGAEAGKRPVEQVSWNDINEKFLPKLAASMAKGFTVRLPTEAEWEYSCRAGTSGDYAGELEEMGWYKSNSGGTTHPIGQKKANAWGLYDMHGNVWEWCKDWFGLYPRSDITDPTGGLSGSIRVNRGGCWHDGAADCRSVIRGGNARIYSGFYLGFRVAMDIPISIKQQSGANIPASVPNNNTASPQEMVYRAIYLKIKTAPWATSRQHIDAIIKDWWDFIAGHPDAKPDDKCIKDANTQIKNMQEKKEVYNKVKTVVQGGIKTGSPLEMDFRTLYLKLKKAPPATNRQQIDAIIKEWQDFIAGHPDASPDDKCIRDANTHIKNMQDMKELYNK